MRRGPAGLTGLLALLVLGLAPAPAPAQDAMRLDAVGSATFPERAFRLTVPERRELRSEQVRLAENGDPVGRFSLIAAGGRTARDFGAVLVIDASKSMRGRAIEGAIGAARQLARQRTGRQQIGIVVFNRRARVVLELTDDQQAIDGALIATPPLAAKTHVFDAVDLAVDMLARARIAAGSVVVLSDGADTGSRASVSGVTRRARRADVRIFSVGLRSGAFDPGELHELAAGGGRGGRYVAAESVDELDAIFRALGAQLASQYLVRYRSLARPGREVRVAVRVAGAGGVATSAYRVPGDASFVLVEDSFWTSTLGVGLTTGLCSALLAIAFAIVLVRRHRRPGLRERVGEFVTTPGAQDAESDGEPVNGPVAGSAERSLERTRWWGDFKETVEIARIEMTPMRIVTLTAAATVAAMYLAAVILGSALAAPPTALVVFLAARAIVRSKLARQRREFADQLPDVLQGSASAIRAGHGLVGALALVAADAPEPSGAEFRRVVADEQLGVPLDEALRVVQRRMDSNDVRQIALVAEIQRETGGNMAEVLDRVTEALRQRGELRRMVRGLTAQGRLTRGVLTALPIVLLVVISILSPSYMEPLFDTTTGVVLLVLGAVLVTAGSLVIKKIVDFEV